MTAPTRPDDPTLAEDLLLLLFQPPSGTIAGENTLFHVLGGAVLAELSLHGHLQVAASGRLETVGARAPQDALLRPAWEYVDEKPRRAQTVLAAAGPSLRAPVLERLVERGDVERTERRRLLLRTPALGEGRTGRRDRLLAQVRAVLVDGVEPTPRTAALAALLSASGSMQQLQPVIPWTSPVIERAERLRQGSWGAGAAGEAVTRSVVANVVGSVVVAMVVTPPS